MDAWRADEMGSGFDPGPLLRFLVRFADERACTLHLLGEITVLTADDLDEVLEMVFDTGVRDVSVDSRGVSFLGGSGLAVLLAQAEHFTAAGGRLTLDRPGRRVAHVVRLTGTGAALGLTTAG